MLIYPLRFLHLRGNVQKISFNDEVSPNWYQIGRFLLFVLQKASFRKF